MSTAMTNLDRSTLNLFRDPRDRRSWVIYTVRLQGRSLAQIAAANGVHKCTLYTAFLHPYPRMEKIIADAVGVTPQVLFAERYDPRTGIPNRLMGRPRKQSKQSKQDSKDTRRMRARNISPPAADGQEAA
jgi:Ner family transcriptional regulator